MFLLRLSVDPTNHDFLFSGDNGNAPDFFRRTWRDYTLGFGEPKKVIHLNVF